MRILFIHKLPVQFIVAFLEHLNLQTYQLQKIRYQFDTFEVFAVIIPGLAKHCTYFFSPNSSSQIKSLILNVAFDLRRGVPFTWGEIFIADHF